MKRKTHLFLLSSVVLGLLLIGGSLSAAPPSTPAEVHLQAGDHGRHLGLSGQLLVVDLESNPSTGYGWEVQGLDTAVLKQVGKKWTAHDSNLLGASGTTSIRFAGVAAGRARIDLAYRRPWEENAAATRTFTVHVQVTKPTPHVETPEPQADEPAPTVGAGPSSYNWCVLGACTPIRDQGACGSCWAFGTVGPLESAILIAGGSADLSEQYLVSCNTDNWGCNGGWFAHDYHLASYTPATLGGGEPEPGAVAEGSFHYTASDEPCGGPYDHPEAIDSWAFVGSSGSVPSVEAIKQAIYNYGPVAAAVCVDSNFQSYRGGVFNPKKPCNSVNHAIVLVGWDDTDGAWILRNSWGTSWGENGYMRIAYGKSNVGYAANYVVYQTQVGCADDSECPNGQICCGQCVEPPDCTNCSDTECQTATCDDMTDRCNPTCVKTNVADGVTCSSGYCLDGTCVECIDDSDCLSGLCCGNQCFNPPCSLDTDCDDSDTCTADTCFNPGSCNAYCEHEDLCVPVCGDGICEGVYNGEDCRTCPSDCPSGARGVCCGDGKCDTRKGETADMCPADCG